MAHYLVPAAAFVLGGAAGICWSQYHGTPELLSTPLTPKPSSSSSSTPFSLVVAPSVEADANLLDAMTQRCTDIVRLGAPSDANLRCYSGAYFASLNYERRVPNWVMEVVEELPPRSSTATRKESTFHADASVPEMFRVPTAAVYGRRGLSRGHLAPAQLHRHSQEELNATFLLNANIVPQDMAFNATDWLRVESLTKRLAREVNGSKGDGAKQRRGRLHIVSGPAFLPQQIQVQRDASGNLTQKVCSTTAPTPPTATKSVVQYELTPAGKSGQMVAVPTHLFKVILLEEDHPQAAGSATSSTVAHSYHLAAFLFPNGPIPQERDLLTYQVPVEDVERRTGLRFFPTIRAPGTPALPNLCRTFRCNTHDKPLFRRYRLVAQLRAANTVADLNNNFRQLTQEHGGDADFKLVAMEYQKRLDELLEEAIKPIDDV